MIQESHFAMTSSPPWSPTHAMQPFHFRSRTESMDWRRMSALDVDRVAREVDINVLQEFISAVTFCNVEGERCPHCRGPTDGALLKVLRMSQLSTEYLLHCQDYLSTQLTTLEERLQGVLSRAKQEEEARARLEKELQEVKQESRRRKKIIATQQLLLQASANNYHKCQFCEKSFVNYSYLQSHVERRHSEISNAERQKKRQMENMEDGIVELQEKLRQTQSQLAAEREAEAQRRQQEMEELRRREAAEREMMERWKEEERRKFQQEIAELRQLILQDMASRHSSMESKLEELSSREVKVSHTHSEDDREIQQRLMREKELREQMAQKKNEWRKKLKEVQDRYQQEKEELKSENIRLQDALSVEQSTSSGLQALKQQLVSLSSQLREREKLIHSQKETIKKLSTRHLSEPPTSVPQNTQDSPEEEEDDDQEEEDAKQMCARIEESMETQRNMLRSLRGNDELVKEFRPFLEETLEERLEKMGLRKGTKGISRQTLQSLSSAMSAQRLHKVKSQPQLQDLREKVEQELNHRVKKEGKPGTITHQQRKNNHVRPVKTSPKHRLVISSQSPQNAKTQQTPTPAPRTKTPTHTRTAQKTSSTPPFSSEEDGSVEDSAYITSSRGKPSPPTQMPLSGQQKPSSELDWSDSEVSDASDVPNAQQDTHGSVVQTMTKSLERNLSNPIPKPFGGIPVLPPFSLPPPRPSIIKQQAVSDELDDLELSSIEELTPLHTAGHRSSDIAVTSGTSVWSSGASRAGW